MTAPTLDAMSLALIRAALRVHDHIGGNPRRARAQLVDLRDEVDELATRLDERIAASK